MIRKCVHICFLIEYSASFYQLLSVTYVNEWNVNGYVLTRTCVGCPVGGLGSKSFWCVVTGEEL